MKTKLPSNYSKLMELVIPESLLIFVTYNHDECCIFNFINV